ncbi:hypothetical protein [Gellertiella hungarica]|uniref:Uncharacterized protein n=1 Tax=Gellertiella hungarica TaxID=1572859 RepID=A0A7W6J2M3_9HYPH|nr:hypothetical protein [Gellertiella hungarica]MBB4063646.1 hypothetical protein [Gellertiella hungarica]
MHSHEKLKIEALAETIKDLNEIIVKVRNLHAAGKAAPNASARYLGYLRHAAALREALAQAGHPDVLASSLSPIPFRNQLVGITDEQRKSLEWKGVFDGFPFPAPVQFLEAAE